jgi:hypothetical protein
MNLLKNSQNSDELKWDKRKEIGGQIGLVSKETSGSIGLLIRVGGIEIYSYTSCDQDSLAMRAKSGYVLKMETS